MPRPRSLPEEQVLERALLVFWANGYHRTSIADLSEAIGLGPSSLYNAFGSKLDIFKRSIALYMGTHAAFAEQLLTQRDELDAGALLRDLLRSAVRLYAGDSTPRGCAMFEGAGAGSPPESDAHAATLLHKQGLERLLVTRLKARARAGDPLTGSPTVLAKFVVGTMRGLSQLACDGARVRELMPIAEHAARSCVQSSSAGSQG